MIWKGVSVMSNIVFMIDYKTGKTTKKEYQYSIDSWKKEEEFWDIETLGFAEWIAESDLDKYLELVKYCKYNKIILLFFFINEFFF